MERGRPNKNLQMKETDRWTDRYLERETEKPTVRKKENERERVKTERPREVFSSVSYPWKMHTGPPPPPCFEKHKARSLVSSPHQLCEPFLWSPFITGRMLNPREVKNKTKQNNHPKVTQPVWFHPLPHLSPGRWETVMKTPLRTCHLSIWEVEVGSSKCLRPISATQKI